MQNAKKDGVIAMKFELFSQNNASDDAAQLMLLNDEAEELGLGLTPEEAQMLAQAGRDSMNEQDRVVFGESALTKLAKKFMHSSYISREIYAQTLAELIDIFCAAKEESYDILSDEEVIDVMYDFFENSCGGSTELLGGRDMEILCRKIRMMASGIVED